MSSSEGSVSSDEEPFNTKRLQKALECLYDDITDSIHRVKSLRKKSKAVRSSLIVRELTKEAQEIFNMTDASSKDIIDFWLPLWKDEGRVSDSGRYIRLGEEAALLGLEPEKKIDLYDLYDRLDCLFI
jgi:hypothetical protein